MPVVEEGSASSSTPDQRAAHQFLADLRTRIATQPLPYQYGIEARALESLWELFALARTAIKDNPGCEKFAQVVVDTLNVKIRPITAKWHKDFVKGRLESHDGADAFRSDLQGLQCELRVFAGELQQMAYGHKSEDQVTPDPMPATANGFEALRFGIREIAEVSSDRVSEINEDEKKAVQDRRKQHEVQCIEGCNAVGLALSGGGIRSATFSLGVVQVLAERELFSQVDYLSTVSGGGYTGGFLTRRLGNGEAQASVANPKGPDPDAIRYLRRNAKFLSARSLKESWSMVTATLAGMVLNWTAPFLLISLAGMLAAYSGASPLAYILRSELTVFGAILGFALFCYGLSLRLFPTFTEQGRTVVAWLAAIASVVAVCWLVVAAFTYFRIPPGMNLSVGAILAALTAVAPAVIRFVPVLERPGTKKLVIKLLLWAAGVLMPLCALLLFYTVWSYLSCATIPCPAIVDRQEWQIMGILVAVSAVIALGCLDINETGPHRMYRDGIGRTFVQTTDNDKTITLQLAGINPEGSAPYHLINATLNIPNSAKISLRERRSDFFLFSKYWTGSPAVGYWKTEEWTNAGKPLQLRTAMATSGAAFSTHMGLGDMPTLTAMMAFLNLRLGFWIRKPKSVELTSRPGFLCLLREMFGIGLSEKANWLNLSDGGHIENLAVYELIRRRCKFIICVDGEADPGYGFEGLLTVVRHVQIDFGVTIKVGVDDIRPDAKTGLSKGHFLFCRIHYPSLGDANPAGTGFLLYVKLSVTGNESELIKRYRRNNPSFPHQTTLDQFFDEEQFEAYRQLGVHAAEGLFAKGLMDGKGPVELNTIEKWFRQLAKNLLLPE